jgi:F-type H+-transporting ATPase subunit epsilon
MHLKILLPYRTFVDKTDVARIVFETQGGSFGLLPHRRDCVAAIAPGLFTYQTAGDHEVIVAVDQGVMVKTGGDVLVSVRRAIAGTDIGQLQQAIEAEFLTLTDMQQSAQKVFAKLESGFLKRFVEFQDA